MKHSENIIWHQLNIVLGKWSQDEKLSLEDQKIIIKAQNLNVNKYRKMRLKAQERTRYYLETDPCIIYD